MDWRKFIESNPKIMMGKPVIKGTRITVELILEKIASGETFEQVIGAHPHLTDESIRAAIASSPSRSIPSREWAQRSGIAAD